MLLCLNLAGTLVASDLRSCEEEEETKEDEEKKRKEGQEKRKEEETAELEGGDRIPPTAAGRSSNPSSSFNICLRTKEVQTRKEGPTRRGPFIKDQN